MSGVKLSGVSTTVAVDITPGVVDGIAFGTRDGRLCIGISGQGRTYFVALGGDVLDRASHILANALHEIASMEASVPGRLQ